MYFYLHISFVLFCLCFVLHQLIYFPFFSVSFSRDIIWDKLKSNKPSTSESSAPACPFVPKKADTSKIPVVEPPKPKSPPPPKQTPQSPIPPPPKQPPPVFPPPKQSPQSPVPPPPKQPPKLPPQASQPPRQPPSFPPKPLEPPAKPPRSPSPHPIRAQAFDDDIEYEEDSDAEEDEDEDVLINSTSRFAGQNQQKSGKNAVNDFIGQERKDGAATQRYYAKGGWFCVGCELVLRVVWFYFFGV